MTTAKAIAGFAVLFGGAIGLCVCVMIEDWQRRRSRARVLTIVTSERNSEIIGDGAWRRTKFPKTARVRDLDPRGA